MWFFQVSTFCPDRWPCRQCDMSKQRPHHGRLAKRHWYWNTWAPMLGSRTQFLIRSGLLHTDNPKFSLFPNKTATLLSPLLTYSCLRLRGSRGAILPVKWMCNHSSFLEGYYPHFPALLHGRRRADGGKWQWSGLPRCCIKPQVGEIALTLQALQITTLSRLNATAISKKTGYIFHHRRGARFRAREAAALCLALFLDRGRWSVVKEEHHNSGTSLYYGSNWRSWPKKDRKILSRAFFFLKMKWWSQGYLK